MKLIFKLLSETSTFTKMQNYLLYKFELFKAYPRYMTGTIADYHTRGHSAQEYVM